MTPANRRIGYAVLIASVTFAILIARPAHAQTQPVILDSCTYIAQPGVYQLSANLETPYATTCMQIHSSGVTLDCQGYTISADNPGLGAPIYVDNSPNITVQNCILAVTNGIAEPLLRIDSSSTGTVQNNTFSVSSVANEGSIVQVNSSSSITFTGNTFGTAQNAQGNYVGVNGSDSLTFSENTFFLPYQQGSTTGSRIMNNTLYCSAPSCPWLIYSGGGSGNVVSGNTIDGETTPDQNFNLNSNGADDGIFMENETEDAVDENSVSNVYDCGIESRGDFSYSTINNNTTYNTSVCAIGAWWWSNFYDNIVHGNSANGTTNLFLFVRLCGLRPGDTGIYFTNNTFDGNSIANKFTSSYYGAGDAYSSFIPFEQNGQYMAWSAADPECPNDTAPPASQFYLTGNSFSNNNFGSAVAYFGNPDYPGAVGDQGGNVCVQSEDATYPLACGVPSCGSQWNPWHLASSSLLASAAHQNQYAERTVNGKCEMGTYSRPYNWNGNSMYIWVYEPTVSCPAPDGSCPAPQ